ncbi:MAG TPA: NADH-quinone oxidoreductase subunit NuoE [Caldimonas sp.]|jgi:NADH-quinone oxidoreductase subunit E|nr:NADH-quinone oxidoreductase subunit NuoE [Caldimonas sp.]HEX2540089.1 NADH-quinone oxidoreductase subunit NuoE [Caldimonas sp.]
MNAPAPVQALLSEDAARRFEREIAKYPAEHKASAVIACLAVLQKEHGFVSPEDEALVAEALGMPVIAVHEVTTFYNMYNQKPVGRFKLNVCTNLPCQLRGGQHALEHLCSSLHVEEGGTTSDGAFTVQKAECLGACADAPVMLVNDRQMLSFMSDDRLDELVATLRHATPANAT